MGLSRDTILTVAKPRIEKVEMPEWGGDVYVREMSALERDQFDMHLAEDMNVRRARGFITCVCDEQGTPLFSERDLSAVQAMPSGPVDRCCEVIWRLSRMFGKGEDSEKNSCGPAGA